MPLPWPPKSSHAGFTLLELMIAASIMAIVLLAGTSILQNAVKFERHMMESMDSASIEVLITDRIYQDLKFAAPSFNFLMRFDDGQDAYGRCRNQGHPRSTSLNAEALAALKANPPTDICYDVANIVPPSGGATSHIKSKMADYDFYLYDPACVGADHCYRSITLNANDTYPDGRSGKHDFVIITTDTSVKNSFGIYGGLEFYNPAHAFEFAVKNDPNDLPTSCSRAANFCSSFQGLSYEGNQLASFLAPQNIGKYLLLSSPIKNPTKLSEAHRSYDLGYPDLYVHYPLRILQRTIRKKGQEGYVSAIDVRPDFSLVAQGHLHDYTYASNYVKDNNGLEINFHDEEIFGGLGTEGTTNGKWTHYYHHHPHPGEFLKILQAYNGEQVDYLVRPIRIVRYHLSDAYLRAQEAGEAKPDEKLRNKDPCLTRYVYRGSTEDMDSTNPTKGKGSWEGIECLFPGVEQVVFFRPNVSLPIVSFKVRMQSQLQKEFLRRNRPETPTP